MSRSQQRETVGLVVALPVMAVCLGFMTRSSGFSNAFYETVAQVIPVFLLAVAIEERVFRDRPTSDASTRFGLRTFLIAVIVGEAACLAVVAYGNDPLVFRGTVLVALLVIGLFFVFVAVRPSEPRTSESSPTSATASDGKLGGMELPVLKSERLTLRPLTDEDVEILLPAIYEPGTVEWWGDTSDPDYQREGLRNEGNAFAIVVGNEVAGWLSFDEETEPDYREVAFDILLRPAFQHQGLGADALRTLIRWFIDKRGHHRFTIDPSAKNDRAIKAYTSLGFKPVGILRKAERAPDGHWRDSLLMDLLAEEMH